MSGAGVSVSSKSISGFDPRSALPGCIVWFDAADSNTITNSGNSNFTWTSKASIPLTATVASGSNGPTYTTYNGYPALQFNGSNTKLVTGSVPSTGASGATWIAVATNLTAVTSTTPADAAAVIASSGAPERSIRFDTTTSQTVYSIHSATRGDINNNTNGIRGFIETPTSFTSYTNGSQFYTSSTSVTWQEGINNTFQLGQWNSNWLNGYINEVIIFNVPLTLIQYQQVEGYLASKWGLQSQLNNYFLPTTIPGCIGWYDGADTSSNSMTFSSGSNISVWKDKSGNAYNATLAGGTATDAGSGVVFGGAEYFTVAGLAGTLVNTAFTIFIVETLNTTGAYSFLFGDDNVNGSGATNASLHIGYRSSTDLTFAFYSNDLEDTIISGTGNKRVWGFRLPATANRNIRRNGNVDVTLGNSTKLSGFTAPRIGRIFGGNYYIGTIHEIIVYVGDYTDAQIQQVEAYLAKKWSINTPNVSLPLTHPYYYIQPYTRIFQPTDIPSCILWLDAADNSTITLSGSSVTAWTDKSGYGGALSTSSGSSYYSTYSSNGLNGLPTITTGSASTSGRLGGSFGSNLPSSSNYTVFILFNYISLNGANARLFGFGPGGSPDYIYGFDYQANGTTNPVVFSGSDNSSSWSISPNSFTSTTGPVIVTIANVLNSSISLGSFGFGTPNFQPTASGNIVAANWSEMLVFSTSLTTAQQQQIQGYLAWKWGLNGQLSTFSPISLANCKLWLDAADATTVTGTTSVTLWKDKSSNAYSFTVPSGLLSPSYGTDSGGLKSINFTSGGTATGLSSAVSVALSSSSFFIVLTVPTYLGSSKGIFTAAGAGGNDYIDSNGFDMDDNGYLEMAQNNNYNINAFGAPTTRVICSFGWNGTTFTAYANSTQTYTNTYSKGTATLMALGCRIVSGLPYASGFNATCTINEVIGYSSYLSTTNRQQVESYLSKKWNVSISNYLPVNHPYRTLPPSFTKFSPNTISGLSLWLDAADNSTFSFSSGSNVSQWRDKSGNSNNFVSSGSPTYSNNAVVFNGNNIFTQSNSQYIISGNYYTIFTVQQAPNVSGLGTVYRTYINSAGAQLWFRYLNGFQWNVTASSGYIYDGSQTSSFIGCLVANTPGVGTQGYINGTAQSGNPNADNLSNAYFSIGATYGNTENYTGNIYEIIMFNTYVSTSQRQQVEGYLAWKWGLQSSLPSTHAYKKGSP